ncbi:hypothetical protein [Pseudooceanicola nanhaiensis]|uniref:hypothetical protein n=1 Tax=Pseudooceanicola nanhaiensis TaxID=375761 RepID=UPI001CD5C3E4|nr:hypothetical protein [Pseudooceanicola nanhaiensis]MCA0921774.1 hypothetical protein [Pseudooceanicola nanhaiensis]
MPLQDLINSIRARLKEGAYQNEAAVSVGIVLPLLRELGWDDADPAQIVPEYAMPGARVDFALFGGIRQPSVFIEVKGVGRAASGDKQLFEYAFHQGVPICILTDGREWSFYYPPGEGDYSQRRVQKIHLIDRDEKQIEQTFRRYLQRERVRTGEARDAVDLDFRDLRSRREAARNIPSAWRSLVEEPEELLIELLQDQTEAGSGARPSSSAVLNFLRSLQPPENIGQPISAPELKALPGSSEVKPPKENDVINSSRSSGRQVDYEVFGDKRTATSAKSALVEILTEIATRYPEKMPEIARQSRGKSRNHLARTPEEIYPKRPDLARAEELVDGWLIGTNIANREKLRIIQSACRVAGLTMGSDVVISLPNA